MKLNLLNVKITMSRSNQALWAMTLLAMMLGVKSSGRKGLCALRDGKNVKIGEMWVTQRAKSDIFVWRTLDKKKGDTSRGSGI